MFKRLIGPKKEKEHKSKVYVLKMCKIIFLIFTIFVNLCECFVYKEKTLNSQQFIINNSNCYEENGHFPL